MTLPPRTATLQRTTRESDVRVTLALDGRGEVRLATGLGFLDHLLGTLAFHAGFDLELSATSDLAVDDHHGAEDCALALGAALDQALRERRGLVRFGSALAPLDEALARAALDLSGRPYAFVELGLVRERLGSLACEMIPHVFTSFALAARATLHLELLRGRNDHHRAEAAAKALALALREAVTVRDSRVPSLKGVL